MSPPDVNLDKQKRRHWAPLAGMALAAIFGIGIILYWVMEEFATAPTPEEVDEPVRSIENIDSDDIDSGDVDLPPTAPVEEIDAVPSSP